MKLLIYYSHDKLEGNFIHTCSLKTLTEKQINKIKDEIATEVADVNFVQSDSNRVIIKNIMKL
tara:strand:+ start:3442 stop:3630 length:189 start_codon:yes stop_codon:yes gene_type:complete